MQSYIRVSMNSCLVQVVALIIRLSTFSTIPLDSGATCLGQNATCAFGSNVNSNRIFVLKSGEKVEWTKFLEKVEHLFPGKLCVPYVCCASFHEVYLMKYIAVYYL